MTSPVRDATVTVDKYSSSIRASVLMLHRVFITLASNTRGEITRRAG
nr:MAG TPA: hypothetical protein [Caudoviricetes sp.]